jgi:hypothetical protein
MGTIHTKLHNRLGHQKLHDTAVLRTGLRRSHAQAGLSREQLRKRKFGSVEAKHGSSPGHELGEDAMADADEHDEGVGDIRRVANDLVREVEEDDNNRGADGDPKDMPEASDVAANPARRRRIIFYFSRQMLIPLAQLFIYPSAMEPAPSGTTRKSFDTYVLGRWCHKFGQRN